VLNVNDFLSQWLTPQDVQSGGMDAQILAVQPQVMQGQQGQSRPKLVMHCRNLKPIIINKVSGKNLQAAWGDDAEKWIGRSVHIDTMMSQQFGQYAPMIVLTPGKTPKTGQKAPAKPSNNSPAETTDWPRVNPVTGEVIEEPQA
jgi:hypothetical protein